MIDRLGKAHGVWGGRGAAKKARSAGGDGGGRQRAAVGVVRHAETPPPLFSTPFSGSPASRSLFGAPLGVSRQRACARARVRMCAYVCAYMCVYERGMWMGCYGQRCIRAHPVLLRDASRGAAYFCLACELCARCAATYREWSLAPSRAAGGRGEGVVGGRERTAQRPPARLVAKQQAAGAEGWGRQTGGGKGKLARGRRVDYEPKSKAIGERRGSVSQRSHRTPCFRRSACGVIGRWRWSGSESGSVSVCLSVGRSRSVGGHEGHEGHEQRASAQCEKRVRLVGPGFLPVCLLVCLPA